MPATTASVLLVLVCVAIRTTPAQSFCVEQNYHSRTEDLEGHSARRSLLQEGSSSEKTVVTRDGRPLETISQIALKKTATVDRFCFIVPGVVRPGNTYNDPSSLVLEDVFDCCFACEDDDRCVSWTYDRATGACALKDKISEPFSTSAPAGQVRFVSSSGADIDEDFDYLYKFHPDGTRGAAVPKTVDAQAPVPLNECVKEIGVAYPRGNILRVSTTGSHEACCELCRDSLECFSWFRDDATGRCVLNTNVPGKVRRGERYAGATVI